MRTIDVVLEPSYPIWIGTGILDQPQVWRDKIKTTRGVIVTNDVVGPLYLQRCQAALDALGVTTTTVILPDGEAHKDWASIDAILSHMLENRMDRKSWIFALGGGVVGDMAGFAAAIYMRGVPFVQIPTTLLAQVDSSVGGKTGFNHPLGKNMIGAFHQPRCVIADTQTLDTLPDRELSAGLAEVIKYGLIDDPEFFSWLETHLDGLLGRQPDLLAQAIEQSCRNKARIVSQDEKESGVRALLNLGHTFGHAIEAGLGFGVWLHGEAVAAGMVLAAETSQRMGLIDQSLVLRIRRLLERARLPVTAPALGADVYLEKMAIDKKAEGGKLRFVLMRGLGQAFIADAVPDEVLQGVLNGG